MHHLLNRETWFSLLMSLSLINASPALAAASAASSVPNEKTTDELTRTSASGVELRSHLTKNIMKQVPYQDTYTVQVPYQDTETYYEDVPYQDTEAA